MIARAIELHYKPKGPTDTVPLESEGDGAAVAVALADKLDTLVGFWAIGEKPTTATSVVMMTVRNRSMATAGTASSVFSIFMPADTTVLYWMRLRS